MKLPLYHSPRHRTRHIPVMTEENIVALIVEGDNSTSCELGIMREQAAEHPCDGASELGGEVVQDNLREVRCRLANVLNQESLHPIYHTNSTEPTLISLLYLRLLILK